MSRRRIGFWYRLAAVLVKPPLVVLFKRDWRGMEHIPAEGGFLTVVNHNSYLDPLSYAHFQYNTGRVPRFLAKVSLFQGGFVGGFMRRLGQIPVYRESADAVGAFKAAVEAIDKGECVAFYPEGTLTRDPDQWPMVGKTGAARVALLTRAPVIPVAQWGANLVMPPYAKEKPIRLFPRKTFVVQAGPPVDLSEFYGQEPTAEVLRAVTDRLMDAVTAQLADIRGESPPAERYDHRAAAAARAARTTTETEHPVPSPKGQENAPRNDQAEPTTEPTAEPTLDAAPAPGPAPGPEAAPQSQDAPKAEEGRNA